MGGIRGDLGERVVWEMVLNTISFVCEPVLLVMVQQLLICIDFFLLSQEVIVHIGINYCLVYCYVKNMFIRT